MKEIILDTSFIISCVRQKIDFLNDIADMGLFVIIPKQVLLELKGLSEKNESAKLSMDILGKNRKIFKTSDLEKYGKTTDRMIINYSNKNKGTIVATLDREIKDKTLNRKMAIRMKKKLEIL